MLFTLFDYFSNAYIFLLYCIYTTNEITPSECDIIMTFSNILKISWWLNELSKCKQDFFIIEKGFKLSNWCLCTQFGILSRIIFMLFVKCKQWWPSDLFFPLNLLFYEIIYEIYEISPFKGRIKYFFLPDIHSHARRTKRLKLVFPSCLTPTSLYFFQLQSKLR